MSVYCVLLTDKLALTALGVMSTEVLCKECAGRRGYLLQPCMHTCCKACGKNIATGDKCPTCHAVVNKKVFLYGTS